MGGATVWSEDSSDFFHVQCDDCAINVLVHEATPLDKTQPSHEDSLLKVSLTLKSSGQDVAQLMLDTGKADPEVTPTLNVATPTVSVQDKNSISLTSSISPAFVSPLSTRESPLTKFAPTSDVLLTPPTPLIPEVPPSFLTPASASLIISPVPQTRSVSARTSSSCSVRPHISTAATGTSLGVKDVVYSDTHPNTDLKNYTHKDPTWSAEVTTSLTSSSQSSYLSLSSLSDQLPVTPPPPRPVGRAAWKTRLHRASTESAAAAIKGRAAGRRRVVSAHAIGRSSVSDSPGLRLTGRSALVSPSPPHSAPPSLAPTTLEQPLWRYSNNATPSSSSVNSSISNELTRKPHDNNVSSIIDQQSQTPPSATPTMATNPSVRHPILPKVILPVQVGGTFKCRVVFVESLDRFFLQVDDSSMVGGVKSVLAVAQASLEEELLLSDIIPGQLAMAQYEGGDWHRAQVHGPGSISAHHYLVLYVDYGNLDEVDMLKPMPYPLTTLPPQALECCLHSSVQGSFTLDSFCTKVAGSILSAVLMVSEKSGGVVVLFV